MEQVCLAEALLTSCVLALMGQSCPAGFFFLNLWLISVCRTPNAAKATKEPEEGDVARTIALCFQVLWCMQSHSHTRWCPHMERGLAVVISQCCHQKQGGGK